MEILIATIFLLFDIGMGMTPEQAAAAMHAAKMAQLGAMGHNLEKLLPPQFDLTKISSSQSQQLHQEQQNNKTPSVTIEPTIKSLQNQHQIGSGNGGNGGGLDIRRDSSEPMDLGLENQTGINQNDVGDISSGEDGNYSDDEDRVIN